MNTFGAHKIGREVGEVKGGGVGSGDWGAGNEGSWESATSTGRHCALIPCSPIPALNQCAVERENTLITTTPAQIRPMPSNAGRSSFCLNTNRPISEISTMPTPDQIA